MRHDCERNRYDSNGGHHAIQFKRPCVAPVEIENFSADVAGGRSEGRRQKRHHSIQLRESRGTVVVRRDRDHARETPAVRPAVQNGGDVGHYQRVGPHNDREVRTDEIDAEADHEDQTGIHDVHQQSAEPAAADRADRKQTHRPSRVGGTDVFKGGSGFLSRCNQSSGVSHHTPLRDKPEPPVLSEREATRDRLSGEHLFINWNGDQMENLELAGTVKMLHI